MLIPRRSPRIEACHSESFLERGDPLPGARGATGSGLGPGLSYPFSQEASGLPGEHFSTSMNFHVSELECKCTGYFFVDFCHWLWWAAQRRLT